MKISIPVLIDKKMLPEKYTYEGKNINPPIEIENIPSKAKALAVLMEDTDAASDNWIHWLSYDIPVFDRIQEGNSSGRMGKNSWGKLEYNGPTPDPDRFHHYHFTVYALSSRIGLNDGISKDTFLGAIYGTVLAKAETTGTYANKAKLPVPGLVPVHQGTYLSDDKDWHVGALSPEEERPVKEKYPLQASGKTELGISRIFRFNNFEESSPLAKAIRKKRHTFSIFSRWKTGKRRKEDRKAQGSK